MGELLRIAQASSSWAEKCRIWVSIALSWFASAAALKFPVQQKHEAGQGAGHEPSWLGSAGWFWVKLQVTQHHTLCCQWALSLETPEHQVPTLIPLQTHLREQMALG